MPMQLTRRQLLKSGGAVALASFALPKNLRTVLEAGAATPASLRGRAGPPSKIEHVVVLMQENRSFDHYFGMMPGVRGFADPSASRQLFYQPDADNPDGYLLPFHVDTTDTSAQALPSNSHSWGPQHDSWANGAMNGFVSAHGWRQLGRRARPHRHGPHRHAHPDGLTRRQHDRGGAGPVAQPSGTAWTMAAAHV